MATATLAASPATGAVSLFDTESQATPQALGSASLAANAASFSLAALAAGPHRLLATYAGDTLHPSTQSNALSLSVSPLGVNAAPASFAILYGQSVPTLTGTLTGVLSQDAQLVSLALASSAAALSPPGSYAVTASLGGPSAGNYTLTAASAAVTIAKAPVLVSLDTSAAPSLKVQVASTTSGMPSGPVTLLDGGSFYASGMLSAGVAVFSSANLSAGPHTLTASYAGDTDFLPAVSPPGALTVGTPGLPDFTLTANGQTSMTVSAGTAAQYSFAVDPVNGSLASPILLAASSLPPGATASLNPAYLPPSNAPATFVLTVTTPKAALATSPLPYMLAFLLPLWMMARRRSRRVLLLLAAALSLGCGDRVANEAGTVATTPYTIAVTATATQSTGVALVHTASVTLNVQH